MVKLKKTRNADLEMGHARRELDWERQFAVAMNPPRARAIRDERMPPIQRDVQCAGIIVLSRSLTGILSSEITSFFFEKYSILQLLL